MENSPRPLLSLTLPPLPAAALSTPSAASANCGAAAAQVVAQQGSGGWGRLSSQNDMAGCSQRLLPTCSWARAGSQTGAQNLTHRSAPLGQHAALPCNPLHVHTLSPTRPRTCSTGRYSPGTSAAPPGCPPRICRTRATTSTDPSLPSPGPAPPGPRPFTPPALPLSTVPLAAAPVPPAAVLDSSPSTSCTKLKVRAPESAGSGGGDSLSRPLSDGSR